MRVLIALLAFASALGFCLFLHNYIIPWLEECSSREDFVEGFIRALKEGNVNKIMSCYDESAEGIAFLLKDNPKDKWRVQNAYIYEERFKLTREEIGDYFQTFQERYKEVGLKKPDLNPDHDGTSYIWYHYPTDRHKVLLSFELKLKQAENERTKEGGMVWKITSCSIKERGPYAYTPIATRS